VCVRERVRARVCVMERGGRQKKRTRQRHCQKDAIIDTQTHADTERQRHTLLNAVENATETLPQRHNYRHANTHKHRDRDTMQ